MSFSLGTFRITTYEMVDNLLNFSLRIKEIWLKGLIDTLGNTRFCNFFSRGLRREESSKNLIVQRNLLQYIVFTMSTKCKIMLMHQIAFGEVVIKTHFNVWKSLFQVFSNSLLMWSQKCRHKINGKYTKWWCR